MHHDSPHFYFTGGCLALDFVNSKSWRLSHQPNDRLENTQALLSFCLQADTISQELASQLGRFAEQNPSDDQNTLNRALKLRELIYRLFRARVYDEPVNEADLAQFNLMFSRALRQQQACVIESEWILGWSAEHEKLDRLWWPIAVDAGQVLTQSNLAPIRACGGADCGWLFLDTSRNRSRRWCDMRICGNRDKVKRYQDANR